MDVDVEIPTADGANVGPRTVLNCLGGGRFRRPWHEQIESSHNRGDAAQNGGPEDQWRMRGKGHTCFLFLIALMLTNAGTAVAQQSIDHGCGANIGTVDAASNVTVNVQCDNKKKEYLSFNYSRLFGAFEVPLLMEFLPGRPSKDDIGGQYRVFVNSKGKSEWIGYDLFRFWREQLPYKDASPLLTQFWRDVSGRSEAATNIAWRSSSGSRSDRLCFYKSGHVDESGSDFDFLIARFRFDDVKVCKNSEFDKRVGFTFLIIENESDRSLTNVKLSFRQNYLGNRVVKEALNHGSEKAITRNVSSIQSSNDPRRNLISKFGNARDTEFTVGRLATEDLQISKISPHQKLIALLDIFIAGEDDLPASYLYGIYIFDEVQFLAEGTTEVVKVRPPSLSKAARIQVPYGWFAQ